MKGHGDMSISSSHRQTSPHQASITSRTSRRHIQGTRTTPPSYRIGAVPVPVAILFEAVGREGTTEARQ